MSNQLYGLFIENLEENDENRPPLPACVSLTCDSSVFEKSVPNPLMTLRDSQRENIHESPFSVSIPKKGSLQNSPSPITPSRFEAIQLLDEEEAWRERCAVLTRQDHEDYTRFADEIINDLISTISSKVEEVAKPTTLEVPVLSDKQDTQSVSSAEFTPSESSFDTAKEEFQNFLPDLLQPEILHDRRDPERSDTDYESANDSEGRSTSPELSSEHFSLPNFYLDSCILTPIPKFSHDNRRELVDDFDREKTPIPADLNCQEVLLASLHENNPSDVNSCGAFDKEKTPVVFDTSSSTDSNYVKDYFHNCDKTVLETVNITSTDFVHEHDSNLPSVLDNFTCDPVKLEKLDTSPSSISLTSLNEYPRPQVESLDSPLSCPIPTDTGSDTEISRSSSISNIPVTCSELNDNKELEAECRETDEGKFVNLNLTLDESLKNEIVLEKNLLNCVNKTFSSSDTKDNSSIKHIYDDKVLNDLTHGDDEFNKGLENSLKDSITEGEQFKSDHCVSPSHLEVDVKFVENNSNESKDLSAISEFEILPCSEVQPRSESTVIENEEVESLDTSFGKISWQSVVNNSLNDPYINLSSCENRNLGTDNCEPSELEKLLALDAKLIAEELISLSLLADNQESQTMKDRMADVDNNEHSSPSGGDNEYDENVNPFESKPKLAATAKCNSDVGDGQKELAGMKNGELGSKAPSGKTPRKSSLTRGSPTSGSPKRKTHDSGGVDSERKGSGDHVSVSDSESRTRRSPSSRSGKTSSKDGSADHSKDHIRRSSKSSPTSRESPHSSAGKPPWQNMGSDLITSKNDLNKTAGSPGSHSISTASPGQRSCSRKSLSKVTQPNIPTDEVNTDVQPPKSQNEDSSPESEAKELRLNNEHQDPCMVRSLEGEVNKSEAGPDVAEFTDGGFRSAADVFKDPSAFEYLQSAGGKHLSESALARMSLYVKFDPLLKAISPISKRLGKELPAGVTSHSSEPNNDLLLMGSPLTAGATSNPNEEYPEKADGKLLDLTLNRSQELAQMSESMRASRIYSEEEFCQALRMQELLFQEQLVKKDREWNEREKHLENEQHQMMAQIQKMKESQQQMQEVVVEYEKTISQLIADRDKDKQETNLQIIQLKKERDQALEDLQNVETAFADLHRRYEKSKMAVEGFKKNEEVLKNYVAEGHVKLKKHEQKYDILKRHAEEKLECANQEIENLRRAAEAETAALRAQLKKSETKNDSLEKSLEQKIKENAELTNICDELIAKVGQGNS